MLGDWQWDCIYWAARIGDDWRGRGDAPAADGGSLRSGTNFSQLIFKPVLPRSDLRVVWRDRSLRAL
jgi:hypothetical protein